MIKVIEIINDEMKEKLKTLDYGKTPVSCIFMQSKLLVVEEVRGRLISACGIRGVFNVLTIRVNERNQGQGIGTRLMQKMVGEASKKHCFISLEVNSLNLRALHLFEKIGYKKIGSRKRQNRFFYIMIISFDWKGGIVSTLAHILLLLFPWISWKLYP